ncbi:MAG: LysR substrate-binding domain-containing protein [Actinomycetota bacterium]
MSSSVNLRHVQTFLVVAEELHVGRAATRLHVAQPAVSQTIKALEKQLGLELLDRSGRGISLTAAGRAYAEEVRGVVPQLELAARAAKDAQQGVRGRLVVGFTAVCTLGGLPEFLVDFMGRHAAVDVRLHQLATADQTDALRLGSIDVGFTILPGGPEPVNSRLITTDELHAFVSADHPLARHTRIPVAELLDEPFLLMSKEREPCVHRSFNRLCEAHGKQAEIVLEVDHLESMLSFVSAGAGVSLAPSTAARLGLEGTTSRPLDPSIPAGISVIWDPAVITPTGELFLDELGSRWDAVRREGRAA